MCAGPELTRAQAKKSDKIHPLNVEEAMSSVDKSTIEDLQEDSSLKKCFDRAGKQITGENDVGEFFMKNGLLYQEHQETKMGRSSNQLVVPKGLRQQMIGLSVNQESANQLGAKMTEVRKRVPELLLARTIFCLSCDVCQRTVKRVLSRNYH